MENINKLKEIEKFLLPKNFDDLMDAAKNYFEISNFRSQILPTGNSVGSLFNKHECIKVFPDECSNAFIGSVPKDIQYFVLNSICAFPEFYGRWGAYLNMQEVIKNSILGSSNRPHPEDIFKQSMFDVANTYIECSKSYIDFENKAFESATAYLKWQENVSPKELLKTLAMWWDCLFVNNGFTPIPLHREFLVILPVLHVIKNGQIIQFLTTVQNATNVANTIANSKSNFYGSIFTKELMNNSPNESSSMSEILNWILYSSMMGTSDYEETAYYLLENEIVDKNYSNQIGLACTLIPYVKENKQLKYKYLLERYPDSQAIYRVVAADKLFGNEESSDDYKHMTRLDSFHFINIFPNTSYGVDFVSLDISLAASAVFSVTDLYDSSNKGEQKYNKFVSKLNSFNVIEFFKKKAKPSLSLIELCYKTFTLNNVIKPEAMLYSVDEYLSKVRSGIDSILNDEVDTKLCDDILRFWITMITKGALATTSPIFYPLKNLTPFKNRVVFYTPKAFGCDEFLVGDVETFNDAVREFSRNVK